MPQTLRVFDDDDDYENPFRIPTDEEVFIMRDEEKRRRREERIKLTQAPVHEKTTWSTRLTIKRHHDFDIDRRVKSNLFITQNQKLPPIQKNEKQEKEQMSQFIDSKRQMFLLAMSLETKKQEMKKLEQMAEERERNLQQEEDSLQKDSHRFDQFLSTNGMQAVLAITRAEEETKAKQTKQNDIKKMNARKTATKSEIQKLRDQLDKCKQYKSFLDSLTPESWFESQMPPAVVESVRPKSSSRPNSRPLSSNGISRPPSAATSVKQAVVIHSDVESEIVTDKEFEMYFTKPEQLLNKFAALEEDNLYLIQTSQALEEQLELLRKNERDTMEKMDQQAAELVAQIESLNSQIGEESESRDIIERRLLARSEKDNSEKLKQVKHKVRDIFEACCDSNSVSDDPVFMLTQVENKLEICLAELDGLSNEAIAKLERLQDRARRKLQREREINTHIQEKQKEAPKKAEPEKRITSASTNGKRYGRPLMIRSKPPDKKVVEFKNSDKDKDQKRDEFKEMFS
jgi:hypothetical protein